MGTPGRNSPGGAAGVGAGAAGRPRHQRVAHQSHQLLPSRLVRRLDEDRAYRVHPEGVAVLLLFLNEIEIASELLQHVGHRHASAVSLVEEVRELILGLPLWESERKEGVGLDG